MTNIDRRAFLQMLGVPAVAGALPDLDRALAIPANNRSGSIRDVEHVVFLMQENRSFDHYFGTMRGVRGFADPHPVTLPSGQSVWHQDGVLPFRPPVRDLGQTFLPDPPHGWNDTHAAWNDGNHDRWVPNKGVTTMTHHTRRDLPYHFALADAFTVCDNYFCSLLGPTDPNRYHMWSGWVGNDGTGGGPVITNAEAGYDWSTYPERLERAGIPWKIYQDVGLGLTAQGSWGWTRDPFIGNYGDNSLLYFHQYRNAVAGQPLADRAKTGTEVNTQGRAPERLLADFRADVAAGRLPAVSWIVAPEAYTEHPNWEPGYGAWYLSQVVDILASNPAVWSRMALFVTYDEEGGFFDHLVPPTPPRSRAQGLSTVDTTDEIFPGDAAHSAGPYGLGVRVPMIVVSPWTRGGYVNSQVFDHTSLIRFLEARFATGRPDLVESNITPWRRAVVGDLTSAFDFRTPNRAHPVRLPDTDDLKPADLTRRPDEVPVPPADPRLPAQEKGVRPARALPYTLHADGAFTLELANSGTAAAVFHVRSAGPPRTYTVEPGRRLRDTFDGDLSVYGPNGFHRRFVSRATIEVRARYERRDVVLEIRNRSGKRVEVSIVDRYTSRTTRVPLRPGGTRTERFSTARVKGWYDLTLTAADELFRYAGHLEDGAESISDPAMGGLV
ncbi:non-hemolytic phospholipase C [Virgisporangium aliadipatigenens]|uniref:phospholipase C n=1 Tax=Virgisporangium aliadipatigenens TaxID=741659 RepID=A0A8J3YR85_9ACTN|nr:phospholipase C, phosphocholine-specific [Virgisporangium aliadipatigenens]GIJ48396.1 non-hemolytic phospholipase C [Virgisporangium aliadipatigenens]